MLSTAFHLTCTPNTHEHETKSSETIQGLGEPLTLRLSDTPRYDLGLGLSDSRKMTLWYKKDYQTVRDLGLMFFPPPTFRGDCLSDSLRVKGRYNMFLFLHSVFSSSSKFNISIMSPSLIFFNPHNTGKPQNCVTRSQNNKPFPDQTSLIFLT